MIGIYKTNVDRTTVFEDVKFHFDPTVKNVIKGLEVFKDVSTGFQRKPTDLFSNKGGLLNHIAGCYQLQYEIFLHSIITNLKPRQNLHERSLPG